MFKTKFFSLLAIAAFFIANPAQATTITITLGAVNSYSVGGSFSANIDPAAVERYGNTQLVNAGYSVSGLTASPTGDLYMKKYVYVTGNSYASAKYTLTTSADEFGLTWGTIDDYNTLTVYDNGGNVFAIKGSEILKKVSGLTAGTSQLDVLIVDPFDTIKKIVMTSSGNSFEAGNFYVGTTQTPLPPAALLFVSGLMATGGFSIRKKAKN